MNDFNQLKDELQAYQGHRTVQVWNELRDQAKERYNIDVINLLDQSGFIVKWLRSR